MKITKLCLRYIIPFVYERGREKECKNHAWSVCDAGETADSSLFDYIRDEFCRQEDSGSDVRNAEVFPVTRMSAAFQYPRERLISKSGAKYELRAQANAWWGEPQEPEYLHVLFLAPESRRYLFKGVMVV